MSPDNKYIHLGKGEHHFTQLGKGAYHSTQLTLFTKGPGDVLMYKLFSIKLDIHG